MAARFNAVRNAEPLPDPHNVSDRLDTETIEAIVNRLEARGRDKVFLSLFNYFDQIPSKARVLEVGCGTGVMSRLLSKHPGFEGSITGVDQCAGFLEVAEEKAKKENCDMSRMNFVRGDAHDLVSSGVSKDYDVVVMHTVLAHTTHPKTCLRSAAAVSAANAKLIISEGDFTSLSYGHTESWLGRQMDDALVNATFKKPDVVRKLIVDMDKTGWGLTDHEATCVAEVGNKASYWVSFAETYVPRVKASGLMDNNLVDQWLQDQAEYLAEGKFFAACNYYTLVAEKNYANVV
eukprot:CAMPEP_0197519638 /NCGR_PEP_ID=MMETSP1318-20131121/4914_1 /TAXON_ID=552666 /ORGANISM="Partenskyella glossopodia, Strain RCC365" /LENGTH=290 /DNA_ID=CAMNT_0043070741 /DNA_START=17 /DNA_END=889 /DNA_ORIENTATION=+